MRDQTRADGNNADRPNGRRRSADNPWARLSSLDGRAWRNLGAAALAWVLIVAAAFTAWTALGPLRGDTLNNDLTQVYVAATIGKEHGWSHIYSVELQREVSLQLKPNFVFTDAAWFISAPPYAWLVLPLTVFSPATAVYVWLALSLLALIAAWWIAAPGAGPARALWLLAAIAWYPVLYGLNLVQPALIVVLIGAAAWKLADSNKPKAAAAVLALSVIKPQLVLVVPLVLLFAGRWRVVLPLAVIAAVVATLSLLSIGTEGLNDFRTSSAHESQIANNRYFTLAYLFGPGMLSYVGPAAGVVVAALGAYLNRHASYARLFALGIVASTFAATYWHFQDYTILILAAWLFWRDGPPAWQRVWLLFVALAAEVVWPLTPLPTLIGVAVWFAFLVLPRRAAPKTALAAG